MITLIPNSGSAEDADRFAEYNSCHAAGSGEFCSKGGGSPDARGFSQGKPSSARKTMRAEIDAETRKYGPNYATSHRGVQIHTLPGTGMTPYYFAKHPALGSFEHSRSLQRVKNQINDIIDRGMTPRKKASARYQRRKRGAWTRSPE